MLRTVAALAAALTLSACGLEPDTDLPGYEATATALPPSPTERVVERRVPAELPAAQQAASNDLVRLQRAQGDAVRSVSAARELVATQPPSALDVGVELQPTWSSLSMTGLIAVPSCGWWPVNSASGVVQNGQAVFQFPPKGTDTTTPSELQFFFFVDQDGDGKCTEGTDDVFTASLGLVNAGAQVTLTSAQLAPSPYMCSLFDYMP